MDFLTLNWTCMDYEWPLATWYCVGILWFGNRKSPTGLCVFTVHPQQLLLKVVELFFLRWVYLEWVIVGGTWRLQPYLTSSPNFLFLIGAEMRAILQASIPYTGSGPITMPSWPQNRESRWPIKLLLMKCLVSVIRNNKTVIVAY